MSSRPRNIQLFDHITAVVLASLYEAFPRPIDLDPLRIGADVANQVDSGEQEAFDMGEVVRSTVTFLEQEGLLNVGVLNEDLDGIHGFLDVRLTGPGLAILGQEATPLTLADPQARQPWGARLRASLANPETLAAAVRAVLQLAG